LVMVQYEEEFFGFLGYVGHEFFWKGMRLNREV
jgi:hypothetical protein